MAYQICIQKTSNYCIEYPGLFARGNPQFQVGGFAGGFLYGRAGMPLAKQGHSTPDFRGSRGENQMSQKSL